MSANIQKPRPRYVIIKYEAGQIHSTGAHNSGSGLGTGSLRVGTPFHSTGPARLGAHERLHLAGTLRGEAPRLPRQSGIHQTENLGNAAAGRTAVPPHAGAGWQAAQPG